MIPAVQGTSENAAYRIAKNGFGTVASLDPGWYGQGIYFTSHMSYASQYAKKEAEGRIFLVSLVVPGNVNPVTEGPFVTEITPAGKPIRKENPHGYLGKSCARGFQSHYTIVQETSAKIGFPITKGVKRAVADELVVFEPSQALPLFLVFSSQGKQIPNELIQSTVSLEE